MGLPGAAHGDHLVVGLYSPCLYDRAHRARPQQYGTDEPRESESLFIGNLSSILLQLELLKSNELLKVRDLLQSLRQTT